VNKEEKVNEFLNIFFNFHHERNNLIFDNFGDYANLYFFLTGLIDEFREYNDIDFKEISRVSFLDKIKLIQGFYDKYNIDINLEDIISNGTLNIEFNSLEEVLRDNDYDLLLKGENNYINKFKTIDVYDNQLLTDSIILVHELSHYRNQPDDKRSQVNNLLTESLAFFEELIYCDYLDEVGYQKEASVFKKNEFQNLRNSLSRLYPILGIYYLYDKTGSISKENYEFLYGNIDHYEYCLEEMFKTIELGDYNIILNLIWYMVAFALSIYMYISFKEDNKFLENIKNLNDNLNKISLSDALIILGLDENCFTKFNKDKIIDAFKWYMIELDSLEISNANTRN